MCGIIGLIGVPDASYEAYQGLLSLQHRGQDGAGILSYDFNERRYHLEKDLGLVERAFTAKDLLTLKGPMCLGHNRYSTVGTSDRIELQPMIVNYPYGIGLVHNGNVVNYYELAKEGREKYRSHQLTQNDSEVLLNLMARSLASGLSKKADKESLNFEEVKLAAKSMTDQSIGGYSVLGTIADEGLFALRDRQGIRPLILGRRKLTKEEKEQLPAQYTSDYSYGLVSESVALERLGFDVVRDLYPGEVLFIDKTGELFSHRLYNEDKVSHCMFEWVYFADPQSVVDNRLVYRARIDLGERLASKVRKLVEKGTLEDPDIVVPVPETSRLAGSALSEKLKIPYREVLIKNRYIQRSFILKTQKERERAVNIKLSVIKSEVKDKVVLLVDDSIVRGTTSKRIIQMVRKAGARKIYFVSTCPPIKFPCYYGIDFPDSTELVAYNRSYPEVAKSIGADAVVYLDESDLEKSIDSAKLCMACLNGHYPTDISSGKSFGKNRNMSRTQGGC